jgi:UDP-glucuronate 4-epimerase
MKVLITGGAGFIGSYVSRALIRRGDDVVSLDNFNEYYPRECKEFNLDLINMLVGLPIKNNPADIQPVFERLESYYVNQAKEKKAHLNFMKRTLQIPAK